MPSTTGRGVRLVVAGGAALIAVALVAASAPDSRHASAPMTIDTLDVSRTFKPEVSRGVERTVLVQPPVEPDYAAEVEALGVKNYLDAVKAEKDRAAAEEAERQRVRDEESRKAREAARIAAAASKAASAHSGPVDPGSNRALGQEMAAARGWTGTQWSCLDNLWTHENAWRTDRGGIPQAKPASKMASAGDDWQTNPATQIKWGLGYIADRYGTPCGAWAFFNSHSPTWY